MIEVSMVDLAKAFPILNHAVQCHADFMREAIERERQILNIRMLTGWTEGRVIATAARLKLSFVGLREFVERAEDFNAL